MTLEEVEACTILRAVVGSTAHGLNLPGTDDRDEMGICVEPYTVKCGLANWEHLIHRTAAIREGKHDARSQAGDLDLTIYSLSKYVSMALKGNPTVMLLLFTTQNVVRTKLGEELQALAQEFVSLDAGRAFLGYMQAQYYRLTGERGQKGVNRPELVEKYGFDTKYAGHVIRLGYQGLELLQTGKLSLPMQEPWRGNCYDIRTGKYPLAAVIEAAKNLEEQLKEAIKTSSLPEHANRKKIEEWMLDAYWRVWTGKDL